jgi:hypothetical protein
MRGVTTREQLLDLLNRPWPLAEVRGALARVPEVVCFLRPERLEDVIRRSVGAGALVWRDGVVRHDAAAVARARLTAGVLADSESRPFFAGEQAELLDLLPAGDVDRLLAALDQASGYRDAEPCEASGGEDLLARYREPGGRWTSGLLPMAPEAALYVAGYDFAALADSEDAATLIVPGGGEMRLEVRACPSLVAAALRTGPGRDDPPLVDADTARQLPYGACRAIVALADTLSEMGGPAVALRFLDDDAGTPVDGPLPVAAAAHGALPQ